MSSYFSKKTLKIKKQFGKCIKNKGMVEQNNK